MHDVAAFMDNEILHDTLRVVSDRGLLIGATSAAITFAFVEHALSLYAAQNGKYWLPLWDEIREPARRAFESNDAAAFAAVMTSSYWCQPLLRGADELPANSVEQTLGIVARRWFMGADVKNVGIDGFRDVDWAIGLVDCVESFAVRATFPYVIDCIAEPPLTAEVMISRQMLLIAIEHDWSLAMSLENGRSLVKAISPGIRARGED